MLQQYVGSWSCAARTPVRAAYATHLALQNQASPCSAMPRKRLLAALLALLVAVATARAALLAIDLGGDFLKVSVVQAGRTPISVAINEMSRRKTPVLVGFVDGQRVLGEEAVTVSGRQPDKVFGRLRDMIGKPADDPAVGKLLSDSLLYYDVVKDPARGTIRLRVPGNEENEFSIEEVMGSELTYAQQIASEYAGTDLRNCVILVPPYFGVHQRRALLESAELAGLNVLSLMQSHAGAALQYGIERDFTDRKEYVVLYDVSSTDVVAALVEYSAYPVKGSPKQRSQFSVKDVTWQEGAGASKLDTLLTRHFAEQFEKQHGLSDLMSKPKVVAKMAKPVRRTKEILSANTEAPIHVEELFDGIDFSSSITRSEFEELAGSYWDDVKAPLVDLLARNDLASDSNFTLQLLGGGSRVPRVRSELTAVLPEGVRLEKQLDADEAAVMGAGLYAANLSTSFRLRQFGMRDSNMFPVSISLEDVDGIPEHLDEFKAAHGGKELFPANKQLDSKRKMTLTNVTADPLVFTLSYHGERVPCCLSTPKLAKYSLTGLKGVKERYNQTGKVLLHFELTSSGIVEFTKGEARVEVWETIQVDKEVPEDDAGSNASDSEKADPADAGNDTFSAGADSESPDGDASGEDSAGDGETAQDRAEDAGADDASADTSNKTTGDGKKQAAKPKMKKIKVPKDVKKSRVVALTVDSVQHFGTQPMTEEQKGASKKLLSAFEAAEREKRAAAKALNELESYIINTRTAIDEDENIAKVTTEEMRSAFKEQLTAAEDWLYEDEADGAPASMFVEKLAELTRIGDPIKTRVYEMVRRPERMEKARALVDLVGKAVNSWPDTKPWLNSTHVEQLAEQAQDFGTWLEEVGKAQLEKALHEEPAYTISDLQDRFEKVSKLFSKLNSKAAPPPPKPTATNDTTDSDPTPSAANATGDGADAEVPETEETSGADTESPQNDTPSDEAPHDELRR